MFHFTFFTPTCSLNFHLSLSSSVVFFLDRKSEEFGGGAWTCFPNSSWESSLLHTQTSSKTVPNTHTKGTLCDPLAPALIRSWYSAIHCFCFWHSFFSLLYASFFTSSSFLAFSTSYIQMQKRQCSIICFSIQTLENLCYAKEIHRRYNNEGTVGTVHHFQMAIVIKVMLIFWIKKNLDISGIFQSCLILYIIPFIYEVMIYLELVLIIALPKLV